VRRNEYNYRLRNAGLFIIVFLQLISCRYTIAQVPKKIEVSADYLEYDERIAGGAQRLFDNVIFIHEGTFMYCDSAYYYPAINTLDAYSRIRIVQGDTVNLYGEYLHYDGNTRIAKVRRNVRLVGRNTLLVTNELDFNLGNNVGYYTHHADIESGENRLSSQVGYYYSNQQMYYFRDSVVLSNPDYTIYSDTLHYYTPTHTAFFFGPTEIIGDSSYIYCEKGWSNTQNNISMLKENVLVRNATQEITADSLYYERETGYGEGYSDIEMVDKQQNVILRGNKAFINQKEDRAQITDSALFIYITKDDSIFVHADTLRERPDSAGFREFSGYYKVRLYNSDLQGICDSLFYSSSDSVLRLFRQPVLWSDVNQLSADYMEIWTKNKQIDQLHMLNEAMIINQQDSGNFNQVKNKSMIWYFKENEPYKILGKGNGQTVYYSSEENELTVNVAQCTDLIIQVKDKKIDKISMLVQPKATLYPIAIAPREQLVLKNFKWIESSRPKNKFDIFMK
jgi:lipopolysaccharide export system protein LptA